jgi:hypothetical protein
MRVPEPILKSKNGMKSSARIGTSLAPRPVCLPIMASSLLTAELLPALAVATYRTQQSKKLNDS